MSKSEISNSKAICKCGRLMEQTNLKMCLACFVDMELERHWVIYDRLAQI